MNRISRNTIHDTLLPNIPLRGLALLLSLCENTFGLVVGTLCARRRLAVALDLLLAAHVAGLTKESELLACPYCSVHGPAVLLRESNPWSPSYFGYPSPLRVLGIIEEHVGIGEHMRGHVGRHVLKAITAKTSKELRRMLAHRWPRHGARHSEAELVHDEGLRRLEGPRKLSPWGQLSGSMLYYSAEWIEVASGTSSILRR
jgi:hypothetical protein